ncbi:DNA-binding transcriptional regulator Fis [Permianibacter aggregans]|uniref:Putative Fis-like DNA-binding protein n=1 Tax=Permianibacter aggregans TaxID=1510150 RepID=A0A4R6UU60_9GAMM|nr:DNA-binding transcriptional regulator Fis [Permianibacter aggregans]QGX39457.1 DNA-binding transcriptional regulator Fis [Permianibacter aggregans]TDQ49806.1 DNA-binding protein Fis [Permianibacter aggregans]
MENFIVDKAVSSTTPVVQPTLRESVQRAVQNYFDHLEGELPNNLYDLVLAEVEAPMLEVVMKQVRNNQTKAANLLGLNRGTLRKKLKQYDL